MILYLALLIISYLETISFAWNLGYIMFLI